MTNRTRWEDESGGRLRGARRVKEETKESRCSLRERERHSTDHKLVPRGKTKKQKNNHFKLLNCKNKCVRRRKKSVSWSTGNPFAD